MGWRAMLLAIAVPGCGFHGTARLDASPSADDAIATVDAFDPPAPFAISGMTIELPCHDANDPRTNGCHTESAPVALARQLGGPATTYAVTLRVRGVMEREVYRDGVLAIGENWYSGGGPDHGNNIYRLEVTDPAATFYLNASSDDGYTNSFAYDYTATLAIAGDAIVTLTGDATDSVQWMGVDSGGATLSVDGIVDPTQPYDGQFVRLDVTAAVAP